METVTFYLSDRIVDVLPVIDFNTPDLVIGYKYGNGDSSELEDFTTARYNEMLQKVCGCVSVVVGVIVPRYPETEETEYDYYEDQNYQAGYDYACGYYD